MVSHNKKTGLTVAVGPAIGRALGNKGAELDRARAEALQEPRALPEVGVEVSWYTPHGGDQRGAVVGHVEGLYAGRPATLLEIEAHNGRNHYRVRLHPSQVRLEVDQ